MHAQSRRAAHGTDDASRPATANDRFKEAFGSWLWGSMIAATVLHFLVFALWPEMQVADFALDPGAIETIDLPDELDVPEPPEPLARPAEPVMSDAVIDEDVTIERTVWDEHPPELAPPPETTGGAAADARPFSPFTVAPALTNATEVERRLQREYPPLLRDAGIGGTVQVRFYIDEEGQVRETVIHESSGHRQLDEAALRVADVMRFTAARNRDRKVPVWISMPITFRVR